MPALDAFHAKQQAFEDLHTPAWHYYVENFTASIRGEVAGTLGVRGFTEQAVEFTSRLVRTVNNADIFYCARLMRRLVWAAVEVGPGGDPVRGGDRRAPGGGGRVCGVGETGGCV